MAARSDPLAALAQFEAYFVRADLDKDGMINGQEAVRFLKGSGLPQDVLAKIWMYADQRKAGFLGREEFYNALKLVTVAQTGRELSPDIIQAAFKTPTIPPPMINIPANPIIQTNHAPIPNHFTNLGGSGPAAPPSSGVTQEVFPTRQNFIGPPQTAPATATATATSLPVQWVGLGAPGAGGMIAPHPSNSNAPSLSTNWFSGQNSGALVQGMLQRPINNIAPSGNHGAFGSVSGLNARSQTAAAPYSIAMQARDTKVSPAQQDSQALVVAGNGHSSDSFFGGDMFSASSKENADTSTSNAINSFTTYSRATSAVPVSQSFGTVGQDGTLRSTSLIPAVGNQMHQIQSFVKLNQVDASNSTSALLVSGIKVGNVGQATSQPQLPWPKFLKDDIEKYTGIFLQVDKDRDGKITRLEADDLFLSWRLPREVLKQVWDLSDQDNDSMLSLSEFCVALYLMQRFREGRPLPPVLPDCIRSDQTLLFATTQQVNGYRGPTLQSNNAGQVVTGSQPLAPVTSAKPPLHPPVSRSDGPAQPIEQKSKVPVLEKHLVDQLSTEEQSALNSKFKEAADAEKRVQELEKETLEFRQRIEFYNTKQQELVLYKSRCDNRLIEIMERISAEKREVDILAKKYEEKYKRLGDVASRLTIEEATFRDIQERKIELYNAIVKMEQGKTEDGLQGRADKIQTDLEGLVKVLSERCKEYGLRAKPTTLIELPFGWQTGIQEGSALWDEEWDKFGDEGFAVVKELTNEVENLDIAKPKPSKAQNEKVERTEKTAEINGEIKVGKEVTLSAKDKEDKTGADTQQSGENGTTHAEHGDDSAKSPPESPGRNVAENTHGDAESVTHDVSPHAQPNNSDQGGAESPVFRDNFASEQLWGPTFDDGDDTDSVWSYNSKESEHQSARQNYSFGSEDFGLFPPIKVGSSSAASTAGKDKGPFFDSAPLFNSGFSPKFNSVFSPKFNSGFSPKFNSGSSPKSTEGREDYSFDTFGQFDSFGMHDDGHDSNPFPQHESLGRFDSFRSTSDYVRGEPFPSFDSFRNPTDYDRSDSLARFDSFRSTTDHKGPSLFDESDFFGSKSFKSSESHSPRNGTSNWNAF